MSTDWLACNEITSAKPATARQPVFDVGDTWLLLLFVVVGLNLRPLLTSISPLLSDIRSATGMRFQAASMLTTLPVMMMGCVALLSARLSRLVGDHRGIAAGLAAIAIACAYRFFADSAAALILSAGLAGVGVAIIQALMPGVIKHNYAQRMSLTMGLYSAALMGGGGLGAVLSPWVAKLFGSWHAGLAMWALPATFAFLLWTFRHTPMPPHYKEGHAQSAFYKIPRAWLLAIHFGWINGGYTSMVAWLPQFYREHGWTMQSSGSLLGLMTAAQVIASLLLPLLARHSIDRRPWLVLGLLAQFAGFAGLIVSPDHFALVWIAVLGFGLGGTFSLCLILALDHLKQPRQAGELVAFVQGIGFMIAALAPFATGFIRDMTGDFVIAWVALACSVVVLLIITLRFDPKTYRSSMRGLD